jgi:hypothetical protein
MSSVIFDFDNTLFDTERLKDMMRQTAVDNGCTPEEARIVYERARSDKKGNITISLDYFITTLCAFLASTNRELPAEAATRLKERLSEIGPSLMFAGVRDMLRACSERFECYLLSLGVPAWQREKIFLADIERYFSPERIIFTDREGGKVSALRELFGEQFDGKETVLFNDRPEESTDLLKEFPKLQLFIRRDVDDQRYRDDAIWKSLYEQFPGRVVIASEVAQLFHVFSQSSLYAS